MRLQTSSEYLESPTTVVLGPLFPRIVAAYFSIPIALVFWILPLVQSALSRTVKAHAFVLGCSLLCIIFLPRKGTLEIDVFHRITRFQEGVASSLFHFWRKREVNQLSLPPNSKIVIGEWLNELAFPTLGIKRVAADDETEILFERRFAFDQAIASHIITELQGIGDIEVEAIRLNASFQQIKWSPKPGKVSSVRGSLFLLSFAGYPAGIFLNYVGMICAGFVCLLTFVITTYRVKSSTQNKRDADRSFARILFGFRALQFVLTFTILAIFATKTVR